MSPQQESAQPISFLKEINMIIESSGVHVPLQVDSFSMELTVYLALLFPRLMQASLRLSVKPAVLTDSPKQQFSAFIVGQWRII